MSNRLTRKQIIKAGFRYKETASSYKINPRLNNIGSTIRTQDDSTSELNEAEFSSTIAGQINPNETLSFKATHSSYIDSISFDPNEVQLSVQFKNGDVYSYEMTPVNLYYELKNAEDYGLSVGKSFWTILRNKFPFSKK